MAQRFKEGGFDLLALRVALDVREEISHVYRYMDLFSCPSFGICDEPEILQGKMEGLAQVLGEPRMIEGCTANYRGLLRYSRWDETRTDRVVVQVFSDPEEALGIAKKLQGDEYSPYNYSPIQLVDERLRRIFEALDPEDYSTFDPPSSRRNREVGHQFFYLDGRVLTLVSPRSPTDRGYDPQWHTSSSPSTSESQFALACVDRKKGEKDA